MANPLSEYTEDELNQLYNLPGVGRSFREKVGRYRDKASMPQQPGYTSFVAPGTRGEAQGLMRTEAMQAPGAVTPWVASQRGLAATGFRESSGAAEDAARKAAQASSAQMSMQGGLSGGARERLMQGRNLAASRGAAQAGTEYQKGLLGIGSAAEKNRLASIQGLGQMEEQGLSRDVQLEQLRNTAAQNAYNQQMSAWAANRTAEAQKNIAENTGGLFGKGGFLGLGL